MTKTLIGLSGFIGSGKSTVARVLSSQHHFREDSFAASVKDVCAAVFGWPRHLMEGDTPQSRSWRNSVDQYWERKLSMPGFSPRRAMYLIGTTVFRDIVSKDMWINTVENRLLRDTADRVVISDVRFINEIAFIRQHGGIMVRVDRGPLPNWYSLAEQANSGDGKSIEEMAIRCPDVNISEKEWIGTKFDFVINNNGNIDDLSKKIEDIMYVVCK